MLLAGEPVRCRPAGQKGTAMSVEQISRALVNGRITLTSALRALGDAPDSAEAAQLRVAIRDVLNSARA